jgi:hypothetical protein
VSRRPPLVPLTVLCIATASLLLAACGGSSPTNAASAERSQEQKAETKFADFAKCLREHGVNAEAVSHAGGAHGLKVSPGQAGGGPAAMEAAEKACARYRPEPQKVNLSPQQKVEQEEAVQKFSKCMREHGIKVEASTKGGGVQIGIHVRAGEAGAPNPESPAFQAAQKACQRLLPAPPGGSHTATGAPPPTGNASGKEGSGSASLQSQAGG